MITAPIRSSRPVIRAPRSRIAGAWPASGWLAPSSKAVSTSALIIRRTPHEPAWPRSSLAGSRDRRSTQRPPAKAVQSARSGRLRSAGSTTADPVRARTRGWTAGWPGRPGHRARPGRAVPRCGSGPRRPRPAAARPGSAGTVYGSVGCSRICSTGPASTTAPWLSTIADWAMLRTRARLCVMKIIASWRSCCRRRSSSTITACTDTSRAEVTSSQTSSSGSTTRARAIATRCRSPPDS